MAGNASGTHAIDAVSGAMAGLAGFFTASFAGGAVAGAVTGLAFKFSRSIAFGASARALEILFAKNGSDDLLSAGCCTMTAKYPAFPVTDLASTAVIIAGTMAPSTYNRSCSTAFAASAVSSAFGAAGMTLSATRFALSGAMAYVAVNFSATLAFLAFACTVAFGAVFLRVTFVIINSSVEQAGMGAVRYSIP